MECATESMLPAIEDTANSGISTFASESPPPDPELRVHRVDIQLEAGTQSSPPPPRTDYIPKWISIKTQEKIQMARSKDGTQCNLCGYVNHPKRTWVHVKQHFLRVFCPCGY